MFGRAAGCEACTLDRQSMQSMSVREIAAQVEQFEAASGQALATVREDGAASPVLVAVVSEFNRKAQKAVNALATADEQTARETIFELEQAADSANYAAVADPGAAEPTKEAVYAAHEMVCAFKQAMLAAGVHTTR
jgi:hypothetical protein